MKIGTVTILTCIAVQWTCASEFQLHNIATGEEYGPFQFCNGGVVTIGESDFRIETATASKIEKRMRSIIIPQLEFRYASLSDVVASVLTGDMQMWVEGDSALVTHLDRYPQFLACHVFLAAGEMEEVLRLVSEVETWAKEKGCHAILASGRKGWVRVLESSGYKEFSRTIKKEL